MNSIVDYFEALLKIQLFAGVRHLRISKRDQSYVDGLKMCRSVVQIRRNDGPQVFEGMAEAPLAVSAYLFALAECYEKYCIWSLQNEMGRVLDTAYAYGLGVGFRKSAAERRAWGEFYERKILTDESRAIGALKQETPVGVVYLHKLKSASGSIGTGYGTSEKRAEASALRSLYRKHQFAQENKIFRIDQNPPTVHRITPASDAWLECYLIGTLF